MNTLDTYIAKLVETKTRVYIISPQIGDAIMATGDLLSRLAQQLPVTVVNIFTGPPTDPAIQEQILADKSVLGQAKATVINLGFVRSPHAGAADTLATALRNGLRSVIDMTEGPAVVFCPLGHGTDADYQMVREVSSRLFAERIVYYADRSDVTATQYHRQLLLRLRLAPFTYDHFDVAKRSLIKQYWSLIKISQPASSGLFQPEVYYLPTMLRPSRLIARVYDDLTVEVKRQWRQVWSESRTRHFFNSPEWFEAALKTFAYSEYRIVICFDGDTPVGILPVVLTSVQGLKAYTTPGTQYADQSSLTVSDPDPEILKQLLNRLAQEGAYYLKEMDQVVASSMVAADSRVAVTPSSVCPFMPLAGDPYSYLKPDQRRRIAKTLAQGNNEFSLKVYSDDIHHHLEVLQEIEAESAKGAEFKAMFADDTLPTLYGHLEDMAHGSVLTAILYYRGEPICYQCNLITGQLFNGCNTAYKLKYRHLLPGKLLTYLLLPELISRGVTIADFSRGDNGFKRDFTPYAYRRYHVFYSSDATDMVWWKTVDAAMKYLERHHGLYEFIRIQKNRLARISRFFTPPPRYRFGRTYSVGRH